MRSKHGIALLAPVAPACEQCVGHAVQLVRVLVQAPRRLCVCSESVRTRSALNPWLALPRSRGGACAARA